MKRYIITAAVPGCEIHEGFISAIKNYNKRMKAEHLIIPTPKLYKKDTFHSKVASSGTMLEKSFNLNNNISISLLPINPEQTDPITGLDRLSHNEKSVIYGSPKQRLKSVASPSNDFPRVLMTPGACTRPYKRNNKRTMIATQDQVIGAIIVEIESPSLYHFRQVQAAKDGSFVDLGVKYSPDGKTSEMKVEALIPGDWHTGYTDPNVRKNVIEMLKIFKPNYLILHDLFDGISVNHHISHNLLLKAMLGAQNNVSAELQLNAIELAVLEKHVKKQVVVVKSNHDEFLDRWLNEGKYLYDTQNHIMGLELALAKARGHDPVEYGILKYQNLKRTKFLKSDSSFKITPKQIECGMHGHLGPNGARGSSAALEKSFLSSVSGHSHSPEILRNIYIVGTSTHLRLNYNKGPSSWMQTLCIVYANGDRQLINFVGKKWKA